jgi:hypothetical protein
MAIVPARPAPLPKLTAARIAHGLATDPAAPYHYLTQFVVLPNVNGKTLPWESDLLAVSSAGYLTEVEIKISAGDWRADALKDKWKTYSLLPGEAQQVNPAWAKVKYFWYAAPQDLAARFDNFDLPPWAGVYGMQQDHSGRVWHQVLRKAAARPGHRKLNDDELKYLAHVGAQRYWDQRMMRTVK